MGMDKLKPAESLGFLAWKVSRLLTNDLSARFMKSGVPITVEQWRALVPLYKLDGLSQGELCSIMSQEKTGVSRLVAALEKRGYVRRKPCNNDRRIKFIFITDAGRELLESTVDMVLESRKQPVKDIDPEELAICYKVLWRIIEPTLEVPSGCAEGKKKTD